ncbi:MAG: ABC transporter ATP-binding protein [Nitrosomonadaceae bacterium]|nr:ABC transporter ATP-binding protein [Nitrosomonadaceae bacterium]
MNSVVSTNGTLILMLRIWHHLSQRRKFQFVLLLGLMLISAFAEIVSLGAVLPFLGILISPERVFNHPLVANLVKATGFTSADQLVLPLTIAFVTAALMAGAIRMFVLWVSARLAFASGTDLSINVYQRTLYQPYSVHLSRNSSDIISGATSKVGHTVTVLTLFVLLVSSAVSMVAIIGTLIAIDPVVALVAAGGFGLSYGLVTVLTRRQLKLNSEQIASAQTKVIKTLQEGLGGIRDVLLDGTQSVYCNIYSKADFSLKRAMAGNLFIAGSPRFAMEALGITLIAALAYGLSNQPGGVATALPTLGALALGTQRLLPALQQAYGSWSGIVGSRASMIDTIELLDQPFLEEEIGTDIVSLHFREFMRFDNVRFRYNSEEPWVLDSLNLTIPKGARVGFVGSTGSGKSTTLDLLMGLLYPTEGKFLIDGQPITEKNVRAWQRTIAHVPQSIFLADSTIAENIAFGVPLDEIDLQRVMQAAHRAQIADFIKKQLEGYNTFVGERGIRLSGGQRQRIGIARALYKQASVLVFDEATSALDNATEQSVMCSIEGLSPDLTILIIAHRLTTVQHCDVIVELGQGRVVAQGTYDQLCKSSPSFRAMTRK